MIINFLIVGYWLLAGIAVFKFYRMCTYLTNHCVEDDKDFYDVVDPNEAELEKWRGYHEDIASGLSHNQ